ncbi:hypothetical protein [Cohnella sp.]|uniref:hypothetical protein n=1 Tax=Cohnella sp. TaxID=1883426 RepID=UPI003568A092
MKLAKMIGLDMHLPAGKLPGFYAQIIKGIAQNAPLYGRYKELLIFKSEDQIPQALKVLEHYRVPSERCDLLLLPPEGLEQDDLFDDYAIITRNENIFVDLALVALFTIHATKPDAEPAPALLQLKEHMIGNISSNNVTMHLIDRQLKELADRIAKAYSCDVEWHY